MSEYWKSTPKYWCKACQVFVRDTKLERTNHEATGKHQGAIKRQLRDIHRNHEQGEREKGRAKREVERLNGVVSGTGSGSSGSNPTFSGATRAPAPQQQGQASQAERQRQLEQLAGLGVNIPTELRSDLALAGDWTVTATRVINDNGDDENKNPAVVDGRATGVKRARDQTEEEKDAEEVERAFNESLRKKPRKWGRGEAVDEDLDALLSGPIVRAKKEEEVPVETIKKEEDDVDDKSEEKKAIKVEEDALNDSVPENRAPDEDDTPPVKPEPVVGDAAVGNLGQDSAGLLAEPAGSAPTFPVFKKRKPRK